MISATSSRILKQKYRLRMKLLSKIIKMRSNRTTTTTTIKINMTITKIKSFRLRNKKDALSRVNKKKDYYNDFIKDFEAKTGKALKEVNDNQAEKDAKFIRDYEKKLEEKDKNERPGWNFNQKTFEPAIIASETKIPEDKPENTAEKNNNNKAGWAIKDTFKPVVINEGTISSDSDVDEDNQETKTKEKKEEPKFSFPSRKKKVKAISQWNKNSNKDTLVE